MNKVIFRALIILFLGCLKTGSGQITESFESGVVPPLIQSPGNHRSIENLKPISGICSLHQSSDTPESVFNRIGLSLLKPRRCEVTSTAVSSDLLFRFGDLAISGAPGYDATPQEPAQPAIGDIIFTEIMARPQPAVSLPGEEYLEIRNRSAADLSLKGLQLCTSGQKYKFPDKILKAGEYLILCQVSDTAEFNVLGKTAGFRTFPALTDAGRILAILGSTGELIDGIEYSSRWYDDKLKSDGGWSLELIDDHYPFSGAGNWKASRSEQGGTPGKPNSVSAENPDLFFHGVENVFPADSVSVRLKMSETVTGPLFDMSKIKISGTGIESLEATDLLLKEFEIRLTDPLIAGRTYEVTIDAGVTDFAGNLMQRNRFGFGIPLPPGSGDIQFNELLFNPFPGEPDFIEMANCSEKIIDAFDLRFVSVNDETSDTSSAILLSSEHRCILPGELYTVTTDRKKLIERFFTSDESRIFELPDLPSMPDDNGHLILLDRKLQVIDEVEYSEKMHFPLLRDPEGVSLEKVRADYPSKVSSNWQSASETAGWGTPGIRNSVCSDNPEGDERILLSTGKITPDNDGNDDFLVIGFKLSGNGNVVSVWVFDETGGIVKKPADNMLAGPEASVVWNGTADDEKLVGTGIYVLWIRVFDVSGRVRTWKKVCTVVR